MSNSGKPDESKDDALAALHGLHESADEHHDEHEDPEHHDKQAPAREDGGAGSAASGFVGMLAKEGSPDPNSGSGAPVGGKRPRASTDEIHMAREIEMAPREESPAPRPTVTTVRKKIVPKVPGWYHVAMPMMFTLGTLLVLIGFWALGAVIYMMFKTPKDLRDSGYPLISVVQPDIDIDVFGFSQGSKIMAGAMLICLPVAISMMIMGTIMQKRISAANKAAGK